MWISAYRLTNGDVVFDSANGGVPVIVEFVGGAELQTPIGGDRLGEPHVVVPGVQTYLTLARAVRLGHARIIDDPDTRAEMLAAHIRRSLGRDRYAYGIAEIAEALGVRRQAVALWHHRGQLPPPSQDLAMGPIWLAEVIEPWIAGRRTVSLSEYIGALGDQFSGGDPDGAAAEWLALMPAVDARSWMETGFWDPSTAAAARAAGLSPEQAVACLKAVPLEQFGGGYVRTASQRVYAACNGDVTLPW